MARTDWFPELPELDGAPVEVISQEDGEPALRLTLLQPRHAQRFEALLSRSLAGLLTCRDRFPSPRGGMVFVLTPPPEAGDPSDRQAPEPFDRRPSLGATPQAERKTLENIARVFEAASDVGFTAPWCQPTDLYSTGSGTWLFCIRERAVVSASATRDTIQTLITLAQALGTTALRDHPAISGGVPAASWESVAAFLAALDGVSEPRPQIPTSLWRERGNALYAGQSIPLLRRPREADARTLAVSPTTTTRLFYAALSLSILLLCAGLVVLTHLLVHLHLGA